MTAGRVLVLIQVASLRSARQAHALAQNKRIRKEILQSRTEAELCAKPLAQISALSVGGYIGGLNFCVCSVIVLMLFAPRKRGFFICLSSALSISKISVFFKIFGFYG